jgi:large conductance mechanosensitive channel
MKGKKSMSANQDEMLEELRKIRQLLEPKPAPPTPAPPKGFMNEFRDFLSKYRVMGMAVAFILGLYLGSLVNALVNDLIMPIIELAMPGVEWEAITAGPFRIGHFIGAVITFLIVALVIFLLVKITKRMGIE